MILMQPVLFVAWVPYQPVQHYTFQCPVWIPDDVGAQTRFFNEACRQHMQAWSYPTA